MRYHGIEINGFQTILACTMLRIGDYNFRNACESLRFIMRDNDTPLNEYFDCESRGVCLDELIPILTNSIDRSHPPILSLKLGPQGSHMNVVVGYANNPSGLIVYDPADSWFRRDLRCYLGKFMLIDTFRQNDPEGRDYLLLTHQDS